MLRNLKETADLVTFTEEILVEKIHFFVHCNHIVLEEYTSTVLL